MQGEWVCGGFQFRGGQPQDPNAGAEKGTGSAIRAAGAGPRSGAARPAGANQPPASAQMVSYTSMMFIDTLMLSRVGDDAAAAAGSAGMFSFTLISFGFGVLMLVNALVSQSFGRKDYAECGRFLWQGIWWAIGFA